MNSNTHFHSDHLRHHNLPQQQHYQLPYSHPDFPQYPTSPPPLEPARYDSRRASFVIPPPHIASSYHDDIHISTGAIVPHDVQQQPPPLSVSPSAAFVQWDKGTPADIYQQPVAFDQAMMQRYAPSTASIATYTSPNHHRTEEALVAEKQPQQIIQPAHSTPYPVDPHHHTYTSPHSLDDDADIDQHVSEGIMGFDPAIQTIHYTHLQRPMRDGSTEETPRSLTQYQHTPVEVEPVSIMAQGPNSYPIIEDARLQPCPTEQYSYPLTEGSYIVPVPSASVTSTSSSPVQHQQYHEYEYPFIGNGVPVTSYHHPTTAAVCQSSAMTIPVSFEQQQASTIQYAATHDLRHRMTSSSRASEASPISPMPSTLDVYVQPTAPATPQHHQRQASMSSVLAPSAQYPLPVVQPVATSRSSSLAGWADLSPQTSARIVHVPQQCQFPSPSWPYGHSLGQLNSSPHEECLNSPVEACFPDYVQHEQQQARQQQQQQQQYYQQEPHSRSSTHPELTIDTHVAPVWQEEDAASQYSGDMTTQPEHRHEQSQHDYYQSTPSSSTPTPASTVARQTTTAPNLTIRGPEITRFPTHEARLLRRQQDRNRNSDPYPRDKREREKDRESGGATANRRGSSATAASTSASQSESPQSAQQQRRQSSSSISPVRRVQPPLPLPPAAVSSARYHGAATAVAGGGGAGAGIEGPIRFSDPPVMDTPCSVKGKGVDRSQNGGAATTDKAKVKAEADALQALLDKKPFLACEFCRHRKIACGQRDPHPRDCELGDGPRTCNQCARRGLLCCYPGESRRGMRHGRASRRVSYKDGANIVFTPGSEDECSTDEDADDDDDNHHHHHHHQVGPSNRKSKTKRRSKRKPMEWIIAIDAHFITPAAWEAYQRELAEKKAEKEAADAAAAHGILLGQLASASARGAGRDRGREAPPGSSAWPGPHDDRYARQHRDRGAPPPSSSSSTRR
ncbi:hypothetical protein FRB97_007952 [Tulasnella sp. 331]|nr:hypothetical protein FRB97_007952 [Tulasnella sp. 331]